MSKACYITYYGLSEPLLWSQAIPYLEGVAAETNTCFYIVSFEKSALINRKGVKSNIDSRLSSLGFKWIRLSYHKPFYGKLYDIIVGNLVCLYLIFVKGVRIFHARGTMGYAFLFLFKNMKRVKILFDLRGIMAEEYVDAGFWNKGSILYRTVKRMEISGLIRADAVSVLSHKIKDSLETGAYYQKKVDPKKISVIYCAVDTARFADSSGDKGKKITMGKKEPVLLYLGSIGTWYLLDKMLAFFSVFKETFPKGSFLILTPGSKEKVLKMADNIGLNRGDFNILYSEPVNVPAYMKMADLGISFIKPCLSKTASCPTKLGEYLACGLPVVVNSGIGDVDDLVRGNNIGCIVDDFSIRSYQAVCCSLKEIISDKGIKERARATAADVFSLKHAIGRYSLLYKNFLIDIHK